MDCWCWIERFKCFIAPSVRVGTTRNLDPLPDARGSMNLDLDPLADARIVNLGPLAYARGYGVLFVVAMLFVTGCSKPLPSYGTVPNFELTDQAGAPFFSAHALKGRVWVADFIFTNCPGPCPRMSSQMHQVQNALKDNDGARLVSFTIDPVRDTPPVLTEYAAHFEAQPGRWYFLTGPVASLNDLAKDTFHLGEIDGKSLEHSTRLALVDRPSEIRGFYLSSDKDSIPNLIPD